ncbi:hypothetical protein EDD85DRAFT_145535 [Armillaria nabsnona]|nr:hypothetical protein EDD85DRAFT_145535 [Armillaria nabsnona]
MAAMHQIFMVVFVPLFITRASGSQISLVGDDDVPVCTGDQRTLLSIIWSCLATIFACTWLAVHPNVPGRNITTKGTISCVIERAKIIVVTILAPEVIIAWASEQFIVAWRLHHRKYNFMASEIYPWTEQKDESKLTLAHGFLLSMGGFYYTRKYKIPHQARHVHKATYTPPSEVHTSLSDHTASPNTRSLPDNSPSSETVHVPGTLVTLKALSREPNLVKKLTAISPETIEDRSKGDALSKTFSILQISWFVVQCVARAIHHLPITLLETTALAFAGLSMIMYLLWWHKPLNVKYHISLDGPYSRPMPETHHPEESASPVNPLRRRLVSTFNWIRLTARGDSIRGYYEDIGDGAFPFHSGGTTRDMSSRLVIMPGVGFLFGAFHSVAWSFYFPSHTEMMLWRLSSTAVIIGLCVEGHLIGVLLIIVFIDRERLSKLDRSMKDRETWALIFALLTFAGIFAYTVARIMLIILAFLQLRSLPPLAFCTVQWTTYIPHI